MLPQLLCACKIALIIHTDANLGLIYVSFHKNCNTLTHHKIHLLLDKETNLIFVNYTHCTRTKTYKIHSINKIESPNNVKNHLNLSSPFTIACVMISFTDRIRFLKHINGGTTIIVSVLKLHIKNG